MNFLYLTGAIFGFIVVGTLIYVAINLLRKIKPDIPPNSPMLFILDTTKSAGYSMGVLKEKSGGQYSDRFKIIFRPLSLGYDNKGNPIRVEDVEMAIRKERVCIFPQGSLDANRTIWMIYPDQATDLDERVRNSALGVAIAKATEMTSYKDQAVEASIRTHRAVRQEQAIFEREKDKINEMWKELLKQPKTAIIGDKNDK